VEDQGLTGLRVIQVGGGVAPGYATRLLADLGASVTRVEPPEGDGLRRLGPVPAGDPGRGSALFRYLAAATGSIIADLATASGREALIDAVGGNGAEQGPLLVVDALGPGHLESLGLGPDVLIAARPGLALVRISPAGQTGPLAGIEATDLVLQAIGGWVSSHGDPGSDPVRVGGRAAAWVTGAYAAVGGLTAVRRARQTGEPVVADLSTQECLVGTLAYPMLHQRTLEQVGASTARRRYVVPGIVPCADGWVGVNALTGQQWQDICVLFGTLEYDGRQQELLGDEGVYQEFLTAAGPWLSARTGEEIVTLCQAFRIPAAPVGDGRSLPELSHFAARSVYRPTGDGLRFPRSPHRFGLDDGSVPPVACAPELGEPGPATAREPWPDPTAGAAWPPGHLPFAGLRVVDLSIFWAGPYVTMYLASLGADVVKIESTTRPDGFRFAATFPQLGDDWYERSLVWQATNLGKRSLTLDLATVEGLDLLWSLIDDADVVIENFAPRVVEGFGLTSEAVAERSPQAVYLRMPGFGLDGPWRDHVGWAMSYEQASGVAAVTGFADRPPLNPGGFADPLVAMHAVVALHAALVDRERTGHGGVVEIPQIEVLAAITAEQVIQADLTGEAPTRTGNRSDEAIVEGVFQGAGDRWLALSVRSATDWASLAAVAGPGSAIAAIDREAVGADVDRAEEAIAAWVATGDVEVLAAALQRVRVPAAPVLDVRHMIDDPQLVHRRWYETLDHPVTGPAPYPGWPFRFSGGPDRYHGGPAPTLGQHNDEVLAEAGVDADRRDRLRAAGVIGEGMAT
jgi:crotonobetainyl-CoA:carnitine CoA-transferase CaiB-like acyl-CoA transferase